MKRNLLFISLVLLLPYLWLFPTQKLELTQSWDHGNQDVYSSIYGPLFTKNKEILLIIGAHNGSRIVSDKAIHTYAPFGQGPSEVNLPGAQCRYGEDIAILCFPNQIKVMSRQGDTYVWKETKWLQNRPMFTYLKALRHAWDKWYAAGFFSLEVLKQDKESEAAILTAYSGQGKIIEHFFKKSFQPAFRHWEKDYFLESTKECLYLMVEDELKLYQLPHSNFDRGSARPLPQPREYIPIPPDFYRFKQTKDGGKDLFMDLNRWKTSYSAITYFSVEGDRLIVQIRTPSQAQKFMLLLYDLKTHTLKSSYPVNDLFLGIKDGILYFYRNGDPNLDEDADTFVINLYTLS